MWMLGKTAAHAHPITDEGRYGAKISSDDSGGTSLPHRAAAREITAGRLADHHCVPDTGVKNRFSATDTASLRLVGGGLREIPSELLGAARRLIDAEPPL